MTKAVVPVPYRAANGHGPETCTVNNTGYDFNDEILALGATYWVKLVEEKLAKEALAA